MYQCVACKKRHINSNRFYNSITKEEICHKLNHKNMIYFEALGMFIKRENVAEYVKTKNPALVWLGLDSSGNKGMKVLYRVDGEMFEFYSDARAFARAIKAQKIERVYVEWQNQ